MQIFSTLAVIFVFAYSLLQCETTNVKSSENIAKTNTNSPVAMATPEEAPRISLEDAKKDFDGGKVLFIDTRGADQYKAEHIKGSINIPAGEFETRYAEVPKDKKIIAYCS
jgi:predicted sulfurtransferase